MNDTWKFWLKLVATCSIIGAFVTGVYTIYMVHVITQALEGLSENVEITLPETLEENGMLKEIE